MEAGKTVVVVGSFGGKKEINLIPSNDDLIVFVGIQSDPVKVYLSKGGDVGLTVAQVEDIIRNNAMLPGTFYNALRLGGFMWNDYPRKSEDAVISGVWRHTSALALGGNFTPQAPLHNIGRSLFGGNIEFHGDIVSGGNPVSGMAGHGLIYQQGTGHLHVDNLTVRRGLSVYELIINQARGSNGSFWISDTAKIHTVTETPTHWVCRIDTADGDALVPFIIGDIVACWNWNDNGGKYFASVVSATTLDSFTLRKDLWDGVSSPDVGDVIIRTGHQTNTSRQGTIYLTASDANAPYMDVMDGVNNFSFQGRTRVRLGSLTGMFYNGVALGGHGLFSDRVFLTGAIRHVDGRWALEADGSGLVANGAISWTAAGVMTMGGRELSQYVITSQLEAQNTALTTQIISMGDRKNTRYFSQTSPIAPTGGFRVGDEWVRITPLAGEDSPVEHHSFTWNGTAWIADQTVIDGGRITTGFIDAARIVASELFAQDIGGVRLNVVQGSVGGFTINNVLSSHNANGTGIVIDPLTRNISITDLQEGQGLSSIAIRAGTLTPEALLRSQGGITFRTLTDSVQFNIRSGGNLITSDMLRGTGGVSVPKFIGRSGTNSSQIVTTAPTTRFNLEQNKNYTADLPYRITILHNGGSRNGRLHKLHGSVTVRLTSSLIGVRADATTTTLVAPSTVETIITRSDSELVFNRDMMRRASFFSTNCITAYWSITVQLSGDLTYQQWTSAFDGRYWMTSTGMGIDFRASIPTGLSLNPSLGVTEITTSGMQVMWANDRFFRVDGNNPTFFIESVGSWKHDGTFQLNGSNIVTLANVSSAIASDLSAYATKNYVDTGFFNRTEADTRFAFRSQANTFTGNQTITGNLNVTGNIIQSGSTFVTQAEIIRSRNDYIILREGAITGLTAGVFSGFEVLRANGNSNVRLAVDSNAIARVGWVGGTMQAIATRQDAPVDNGLAFWNEANSRFDTTSYNFNELPRRTQNENISGQWNFSNAVGNPNTAWFGVISAVMARGHSTDFITGFQSIDDPAAPNGLQSRMGLYFHSTLNASINFRRGWDASDGYMSFTVNSTNEAMTLDNRGRLGIGTLTPSAILHVNGTSLFAGESHFQTTLRTPSFASGFSGNGWGMVGTHLTVDSLTVRRDMTVYELVVNQIRGSNGALWVTDTAKISAVAGDRLTIDTGGQSSLVPFAVNDLLRCQRWTGVGTKFYVLRVTAVGTDFIDTVLFAGTSPREVGDVIVRQGNTTNTARQGTIYLTSSDTNSPYIDVMDGVNSDSFTGRIQVRLGRLNGITDSALGGALTGFGLYSTNAFLRGRIVSTSGRIGGFEIGNGFIGHQMGMQHFIVMNNTTSEAIVDGEQTFIRRGFGYVNMSVNPGDVRAIRMGQLPTKDTITFPATPQEGFHIQQMIGTNIRDVFRVDQDGALIGGCNFNNQSIWTNSWQLNADGSFHFANGKISGNAAGDLAVDGSMVSNLIKSTNYTASGSQGTFLNLTNGDMSFANIIRISSSGQNWADNVISVQDPISARTGIRIGTFPLSLTEVGVGGLAHGALTGSIPLNSPTTGLTPAAFTFLGQGFISSSRVLTTSVTNIASNLTVSSHYIFTAHVRAAISLHREVSREGFHEPWNNIGRLSSNVTLRVEILSDLGNELSSREIPLAFQNLSNNVLDANIAMVFMSHTDTQGIRVRFSITPGSWAQFDDMVPSGIPGMGFARTSNLNISITPGSGGVSVRSVTGITEISTDGFQSLGGSQQYFRIQQQGATLPFIRSAGFWNHDHGHINGRFVNRHRAISINADYAFTETDIRSAQAFTFNVTGTADRVVTLPTVAHLTTVFGTIANAFGFEITVILRQDSTWGIRIVGFHDQDGTLITGGGGVINGRGDVMKFMFVPGVTNHWQITSRSH